MVVRLCELWLSACLAAVVRLWFTALVVVVVFSLPPSCVCVSARAAFESTVAGAELYLCPGCVLCGATLTPGGDCRN